MHQPHHQQRVCCEGETWPHLRHDGGKCKDCITGHISRTGYIMIMFNKCVA